MRPAPAPRSRTRTSTSSSRDPGDSFDVVVRPRLPPPLAHRLIPRSGLPLPPLSPLRPPLSPARVTHSFFELGFRKFVATLINRTRRCWSARESRDYDESIAIKSPAPM